MNLLYKPFLKRTPLFLLKIWLPTFVYFLIATIGCTTNLATDLNKRPLSIKEHEQKLLKELFLLKPTTLPDTKLTVGEYSYSAEQRIGLRLPIIVRAKTSDSKTSGSETKETLLDLNNITMQFPYSEFGGLRIRDDNGALAFTLRFTPAENFTLFESSTVDKKPIVVAQNVFDFEYAANKDLFFTTLDSNQRPTSLFIYSYNLSTLIHKETDQRLYLSLSRSKDGSGVFLNKDGLTDRATWLVEGRKLISIGQKLSGRSKITSFNENLFLIQEQNGERNLYIGQRDSDPKWQKVTVSKENTAALNYEAAEAVEIEEIEPFKDFIVLTSKVGTKPVLIFTDHDFKEISRFEFASPYYSIKKRANSSDFTNKYLFEVSSTIDLPSLYQFDLKTRSINKISEVSLTQFSRSDYDSGQLLAKSKDEKPVYVSYFYRPNSKKPQPTLLTGYGSYGLSSKASFDETLLPLLNRGFVIATCHVRGSGELGAKWRNLGTNNGKVNSVQDFIACKDALVKNGISDPNKIAAYGRSAGGTLVASALNMDPTAFNAVILKMPFLNVSATLKNSDLPLSIRDRSEWGDPSAQTTIEYLKNYDPVQTIKTAKYPPILIVSGSEDKLIPMVDTMAYINGFKSLNPEASLTHHVLNGVDHTGPNDWADAKKEDAFEYGFLLNSLGN